VCFSVTELLACARFLRVRFWFNRHHLLAVVVSVCVWLLLIPSPTSLWLWWFRYVAAPGCGGSGWCRICSAKTGFFMCRCCFLIVVVFCLFSSTVYLLFWILVPDLFSDMLRFAGSKLSILHTKR
jgi:hypothetical protein